MTDRSNYQQVGVEVDEQSFNQLTQRANDAANSMSRLTQVNQAIADSADNAGDRLKNAFSSLSSQVDNDIQSVQELRAQLTGAADDAGNLGKQSSGASSGGGISGLRRTGSALTQLGLGEIGRPVQILGDIQQVANTFDQFGSKIKTFVPVLAAVDEGFLGMTVALAPLAVLVGAVAVGVKLYNDSLDASAKALDKARVALDAYYKAIDNGTTESVQKQLDTLQRQKALVDAEIQNIQSALDSGFKSASQQFGGDLGGRIATAGMAATNEEFRKLGDRLNELKKQSGDLDGQMQGLGMALDSAAVKANDAAEAILKSADATSASQIEQYKLIREGTSKQIQGIIDDNKDKVQAYTAELATLRGIATPNDDVKARIKELTDQIAQMSLQSATLTQNVLPLVTAREKEAQAEKDATKAAQEKLAADQKAQQATVDAVKKYNDAVQAAEDSADQARISANQKLQDALVAAAQKAVDDANKALDQLNQKRADNLLSLQRDEDKSAREASDQLLNDQIKAQRQERDDLQTHLQNLQAIRDRDAGRQRDDLLNRNYRDLFALNEQKTQDINSENNRYNTQQEQRQQALKDEENDQLRAIAIQRRERLIAYQQANQDAQRQYEIELQVAAGAKQKAIQQAQAENAKELANITATLNQKLALEKQGAIKEIQLAQQTEDVRAQIFQKMLDQAQQLLGQISAPQAAYVAPGQGPVAVPFAEGGTAYRGQLTKVNDGRRGQRESFNGVPFPPGLGLFIPAQSGYINSGGSNGPVSVSIPISITGVQDPAAIGRMIDQHMEQKVPIQVKRILGA